MDELLDLVKEHWSWAMPLPRRIHSVNKFGNVLVEVEGGAFWRICPEKLEATCVAEDLAAMDALMADVAFRRGWDLAELVAQTEYRLRKKPDDHCLTFNVPIAWGGEYARRNVSAKPMRDLIRQAGRFSRPTPAEDTDAAAERRARSVATMERLLAVKFRREERRSALGASAHATGMGHYLQMSAQRPGQCDLDALLDAAAVLDTDMVDATGTVPFWVPAVINEGGSPLEQSIAMALMGELLLAGGLWPGPFDASEAGRLYHFRVAPQD